MRYFVLRSFQLPPQWLVCHTRTLSVARAFGSVLSEDVLCRSDIPPYTCAIRDGWAVRSSDDPSSRYSRTRSVHNGRSPLAHKPLTAGEAVWVNTGGGLPEGADAVISSINPWDETAFACRAEKGENVTARGADWHAGELVLSAGTRVGASETALLAEAHVTEVECLSPPKIGILATGSEIEGASRWAEREFLRAGSNAVYLKALFENNAMRDIDSRLADDNPVTIAAQLKDMAYTCDVVLTIGGTGKGRADYVRRALELLGVTEVRQPALSSKAPPFVVAQFETGCAFMGLPGNPLGVMAVTQCVLLPRMRRVFALPERRNKIISVPIVDDIAEGETGQLCATVEHGPDGPEARPVVKGTGCTRVFRASLGTVPLTGKGLTRGETVDVRLFIN